MVVVFERFFMEIFKNYLKIKYLFMILIVLVINNSQANEVMIELPQWRLTNIENAPSLRASGVYKNYLWVAGENNAIYLSQNNGVSWKKKSIPNALQYDFRDIEVFDEKTAIVMGAGSGIKSVLYLTEDSGNSWLLLNQNKTEKGFYNSIAFWDRKNGLLLGDPVDNYYVVKRTTDGGKTWQRIKQSNLPVIRKNESAFAASGNTLIVGKGGKAWFTTGGEQASVYVSYNYGNNWLRLEVPLYDQTLTAGGYALYSYLNKVFVVGGDYKNRGAQYSNLSTIENNTVSEVRSGNKGLRTAMSCVGSVCIITGKLSSDISFNYGVTWQQLRNNNGEIGFYTLASNNELFLAAGADGKVGVLSFKREKSTLKGNSRLGM